MLTLLDLCKKKKNTKFSLQRRRLLQVQWRSSRFPGQREWWLLWNSHLFISVCHIVNHLTHLTIKPTVTRLHQKEPTNPEPPGDTPIRMHVVNRKQIYKRLCWSVLMFSVDGRLDDEWRLKYFPKQAQPVDNQPPKLGETKPKQHGRLCMLRKKPRQRTSAKQKVAVTNWLWCCPECEERL